MMYWYMFTIEVRVLLFLHRYPRASVRLSFVLYVPLMSVQGNVLRRYALGKHMYNHYMVYELYICMERFKV